MKLMKKVVYEMFDPKTGLFASYNTAFPKIELDITAFPLWDSEKLWILIKFLKEFKSRIKKIEKDNMGKFSQD